MTLGLQPEHGTGDAVVVDAGDGGHRLVDVAVDAAGAGGARPYTYAVPDDLADLLDGEAVLVEFGRRQALGIVLGASTATVGVAAKPIVARVRADGPLLSGSPTTTSRRRHS